MTGQEYLQDIKDNLEAGRNQNRMGENLLGAFGYVRRRATAIDEINAMLKKLGLAVDPPINADMPLRVPRIRFSLVEPGDGVTMPEAVHDQGTPEPDGSESSFQDEEDIDINVPVLTFKVSELESADTSVAYVSPNASIHKAYTMMLLHDFSQLAVANQEKPYEKDIEGIVSFKSMAKALMNGDPTTVHDCLDSDFASVQIDDDLKSVVSQLSENDVVLVIGRDNRLQGIVTAWDLAEEFAELVDPFTRIGEIEERLRTLVRKRLGKDRIAEFLKGHGPPGNDPAQEISDMTMGELQSVLGHREHWQALELVFDRKDFIKALDRVREYRNELMHFRDTPNKDCMQTFLTNFCQMVREIQL